MTRSAAASIGASEARYEIDTATPYRLDLTVSALRRLSTNIVDVLTREGEYVRILDGFRRSVIVRVAQTQPARLTVATALTSRHGLLRSCAGFLESNGHFQTSIVQQRIFHGCGR
jgi:hypothetical protein